MCIREKLSSNLVWYTDYPEAFLVFLSPTMQVLRQHHKSTTTPSFHTLSLHYSLMNLSFDAMLLSCWQRRWKKTLINKFLCVRIKQEDAFLIVITIESQEYTRMVRGTKCERCVTLSWSGTRAMPTTRGGRTVALQAYVKTQSHYERGN
jgi:hypothetical protein